MLGREAPAAEGTGAHPVKINRMRAKLEMAILIGERRLVILFLLFIYPAFIAGNEKKDLIDAIQDTIHPIRFGEPKNFTTA